jgi:drug/metabolite transporter (DMT)-like permease
MLGFVVATKLTTAANAIFLVYTAPLYVALLGGAIGVGAVTAHGLALVWHTPRAHAEMPHAA